MYNQLVCEVCGGQGAQQEKFNVYRVTLCNEHFNELHTKYQEKKSRKALVNLHLTIRAIQKTDAGKKEYKAWIDAEHEMFLVIEGSVKDMIKNHKN